MAQTSVPKVVDRFNQGVRFVSQGIAAWRRGAIPEYEMALRKAATESIGALEWALKYHLRNVVRDRIPSNRTAELKQPHFAQLMDLMEEFADPPLTEKKRGELEEYRSLLRNAAEHDASIPGIEELSSALATIHDLIQRYVGVGEVSLLSVPTIPSSLEDKQAEYLQHLATALEYMDLGGISPRVGSRVVKVKLHELFVSPRVVPEALAAGELHEWDPSAPHGISQSGPGMALGELLDEHSHVVVLGHPGSGKSTLIRFVAFAIASGQAEVGMELANTLPVIMKASEYALALRATPTLSVYEFLVHHTGSGQYQDLIRWALDTSRAVVLVDGLDEVSNTEARLRVAQRVAAFADDFLGNRFVVTSRIVGYDQSALPPRFDHVLLRDFSDQQGQAFLRQWFEATSSAEVGDESPDDLARELWRGVSGNPGVRKLAANPLLLTIIALVNWRGTRLPTRRVDLYAIATETLLENWPLKQRGVQLDSAEALSALEPVAYRMLESGEQTIDAATMTPLVSARLSALQGLSKTEVAKTTQQLLGTIEAETGFFIQKGASPKGDPIFGFLHLTFGEYLAARHLAEEWAAGRSDPTRWANASPWREVLLLLAGHVSSWNIAQATSLLEAFKNVGSRWEDILHRDLFLCADMLADNVRVEHSFSARTIDDLIGVAISGAPIIYRAATGKIAAIAESAGGRFSNRKLDGSSRDLPGVALRKAVLRRALTGSLLPSSADVAGLDVEGVAQVVEDLITAGTYVRDIGSAPAFFAIRTGDATGISIVPSQMEAALRALNEVAGIRELVKADEDTQGAWIVSSKDLQQVSHDDLITLLSGPSWHAQTLTELSMRGWKGSAGFIRTIMRLALDDSARRRQRLRALSILTRMAGRHSFVLGEAPRAGRAGVAKLLELAEKDRGHLGDAALRAYLSIQPGSLAEFMESLGAQTSRRKQIALEAIAELDMDGIGEAVTSGVVQMLKDRSPKVRLLASQTAVQLLDPDTEYDWERICSNLLDGRATTDGVIRQREVLGELLSVSTAGNGAAIISTRSLTELIETGQLTLEAMEFGFWRAPAMSRRTHQRPRDFPPSMGRELLAFAKSRAGEQRVVAGLLWMQVRDGGWDDLALEVLMHQSEGIRHAALESLLPEDLSQPDVLDVVLDALMDEDGPGTFVAGELLDSIQDNAMAEAIAEGIAGQLGTKGRVHPDHAVRAIRRLAGVAEL